MNKSVAIVTGASQGIGRSTAIRLAKDFGAVALVARNGDALVEVADVVRATGAEPLSIALDLSRVESPETVLKTTLDHYGRVDALLNIAGAVPQIDLFEMTDEQWYEGMELKLHGARRLTIRAWDALKANKGSVVFMSGSAALDPKPGFAAVAATNAAIIAEAKAFAEQGIKDGVQVNSIVPGAVMTGALVQIDFWRALARRIQTVDVQKWRETRNSDLFHSSVWSGVLLFAPEPLSQLG